AEDGIRDFHVTGVQTCALPIFAEESNLIHDLGEWVTAEALAECRRWPGHFVSINVSARQFRRQDFVDALAARVAAAGISPDRVQIEITETAIFADDARAARSAEHTSELQSR